MKIIMTTDNSGIAWGNATGLAKSLREHGVEITLAIIGHPLTDRQKKELDGIAYFNLECRQEWMDSPWEDLGIATEWLGRLKKIIQPDVIHLNNYAFGSMKLNTPVIMNVNYLPVFRWNALLYKKKLQDWQIYEERIRVSIRSADIIIASDHEPLSEVQSLYGKLTRKMVIGEENEHFPQYSPLNGIRTGQLSKTGDWGILPALKKKYMKLYNDMRKHGNKFVLFPVFTN